MINVRDFLSEKTDTASVQRAIDYASKNKQTLFFPDGVYQVSSLSLKDNTSLYLEKNAVISALTNESDWKNFNLKPLIFAENAKNISIRGGEICCNGFAFTDERGFRKENICRPQSVMYIKNCSDVTIENTKLTETVGWTLHLDNCDDVFIDGVIIRNPTYLTRKNSDGIDINGCRNVTVINCDIETGDDAICLKNINLKNPHEKRKDMYNINVYNCTLASTCNATKIGTETVGNIYNVSFERITVRKHSEIIRDGHGEPPINTINPLSAVTVQSNDGASVHDITFKDYNVYDVDTPIFILMQKRDRFTSDFSHSALYNISVEGMNVRKAHRTSQILSCEDLKIGKVSLSGIYVHNYEEAQSEYNPMLPTGKEYPDVYNFGKFPSYGIYARNISKLEISDDVVFVDNGNSKRKAVDM